MSEYIVNDRGRSASTRFAVLIPHFNQLGGLEAVLRSCAAAAMAGDAHVIIVDDASEDAESLTRLMEQIEAEGVFARTTLVRNAENLGVSKSLNIGLSMVSEEFVFRIDADDRVSPNRFGRQLKTLGDGFDLVFSDALIVYDDEIIATTYSPRKEVLIRALPFQNLFLHPTLAARTRFLTDRGGYPETSRSGQDWEFWKAHMHEARVEVLNEPLVELGFNLDSVSNSKFERSEWQLKTLKLRIALRYFDDLSAKRHARDLGSLYYGVVRFLPNPYRIRLGLKLLFSAVRRQGSAAL